MRWIFGVLLIAGCGAGASVSVAEQELTDLRRQIKQLKNQLDEKQKTINDLSDENTSLRKKITLLERRKELAQAVLENPGFRENVDEMYWEFTGTIKNTGERYLEDIVVMLLIVDENGNPIEVPYRPPYKGKELMRKFYYVAGSLDRGASLQLTSKEVVERVRLSYKRWHANGQQKVREALKKGRFQLKLLYRGR